MKILKRYILELCFILSFALPLQKEPMQIMVDALWKPITVLLFDGTCYCNSCLYLFDLNCFLTKKTMGEMDCCW